MMNDQTPTGDITLTPSQANHLMGLLGILNSPEPTHDEAKEALELLQGWLNHTAEPENGITDEAFDDAFDIIRNYLDNPSDIEREPEFMPWKGLTDNEIADIQLSLHCIWAYPFFRDHISEIAMSLSLCPLHFCDWAICFDDEDPECQAIRICFPYSHDT